MKLESVSFQFLKAVVRWDLQPKGGLIYTGEMERYKGKPYKWRVHVIYRDHEATWHAFGSPTPTRSKRFIKFLKEEITS